MKLSKAAEGAWQRGWATRRRRRPAAVRTAAELQSALAPITPVEFRRRVQQLLAHVDSCWGMSPTRSSFVVFFAQLADGTTIPMCAKHSSTKRCVYVPVNPEQIPEGAILECDEYGLDERDEDAAAELAHLLVRTTRDTERWRRHVAFTIHLSRSHLILPHQVHFGGGVLGLCESPNHEVFSTASKSLFERRQDGRFVFELPLRITPADAASMAQAEYDARFFLCALVAVVRAPETSTSGVYKRGNERSGPVDVGNLLYRLPMRYSYE